MKKQINYRIENPINPEVDRWLLEYEDDLYLIAKQIQRTNSIAGESLADHITPHFYFD